MKSILTEQIVQPEPNETERVTREDVHVRARELALIDGRTPSDVSQAEYEQAKRELTGESDLARQEAVLDAIPEPNRAAPGPDSAGHEVPEQSDDEEDDEGRSVSEQLAEEGVEKAEQEQILQSAAETARGDKG